MGLILSTLLFHDPKSFCDDRDKVLDIRHDSRCGEASAVHQLVYHKLVRINSIEIYRADRSVLHNAE